MAFSSPYTSFRSLPDLLEHRDGAQSSRGRLRRENLAVVLQDGLGAQANEAVGGLGTRYQLRLALLQYPLRFGPAEELRWFMAETDALARLRVETPATVRERFVEGARHGVRRCFRAEVGRASVREGGVVVGVAGL